MYVGYKETERRIRGWLSLEGEETQVIYSLWDKEEGERETVCAIKPTPAPSPLLSVSDRITNCSLIYVLQKHGGFRILRRLL